MTVPNERLTPLDTLAHDIQNCLHIIGIGLEILQDARGDDARFAETSASMAKSNEHAFQLLSDYVRAAHAEPA